MTEIFAKRYNVSVVVDINNWTRVSEKAQFLIFDEVGKESGKHMAFTSGNGKGSGNNKSFGDSYVPREDVQLILLSNESIYEVYGTYNAKLQRRFISKEHVDQLELRFNIVRLDGNVDTDRRYFTHPSDWTDAEFYREMQLACDEALTPMPHDAVNAGINVDLVSKAVADTYRLWEIRLPAKWRSFCQYLTTSLLRTGELTTNPDTNMVLELCGDGVDTHDDSLADDDSENVFHAIRRDCSSVQSYPCVGVPPSMFLETMYSGKGVPVAGVAWNKANKALIAMEEKVMAEDAAYAIANGYVEEPEETYVTVRVRASSVARRIQTGGIARLTTAVRAVPATGRRRTTTSTAANGAIGASVAAVASPDDVESVAGPSSATAVTAIDGDSRARDSDSDSNSDEPTAKRVRLGRF